MILRVEARLPHVDLPRDRRAGLLGPREAPGGGEGAGHALGKLERRDQQERGDVGRIQLGLHAARLSERPARGRQRPVARGRERSRELARLQLRLEARRELRRQRLPVKDRLRELGGHREVGTVDLAGSADLERELARDRVGGAAHDFERADGHGVARRAHLEGLLAEGDRAAPAEGPAFDLRPHLVELEAPRLERRASGDPRKSLSPDLRVLEHHRRRPGHAVGRISVEGRASAEAARDRKVEIEIVEKALDGIVLGRDGQVERRLARLAAVAGGAFERERRAALVDPERLEQEGAVLHAGGAAHAAEGDARVHRVLGGDLGRDDGVAPVPRDVPLHLAGAPEPERLGHASGGRREVLEDAVDLLEIARGEAKVEVGLPLADLHAARHLERGDGEAERRGDEPDAAVHDGERAAPGGRHAETAAHEGRRGARLDREHGAAVGAFEASLPPAQSERERGVAREARSRKVDVREEALHRQVPGFDGQRHRPGSPWPARSAIRRTPVASPPA